MTFGEKLQELRKKAGLSQDALAEKLEVSRQAVSKWERDETMPETEKVIRIAQLFHVSLDSLLMGKEEPETQREYRQTNYQHTQYQPYTHSYSNRGLQGQLERFARQHGYKAGYIMMGIGAIICTFSLIMYFAWPAIGNSFFGGFADPFGMPQIQVQGDLTPEMEEMIINELIGNIDMGGMWGNSAMNGMMNSALKAQASLFLIGLFPGILLLAAGAFVAVKGKRYAAQTNS